MAAETVESLCQRAREAMEQRNWEKSRQFYLQALGLKSDAPDVHYGLATVCFQMKDLPSAAHHFKEVTRLDPLRAGAYINLGAVYNLLDQLDEAITALRRGIQLDSHRSEGYYNLGLVYRRKRQLDLAIHAYQEALRVNPRMADAHYNLANLYLDRGQLGPAIGHYKSALELRPNWDKATNGLAQAEAKQAEAKPTAVRTPVPGGAEPQEHLLAPASPILNLDPQRLVDPNMHGTLLTSLHNATIDSENHGREFLKILESEIEPAIKELSSCLLYADSSVSELDQCVEKFQAAMQNLRVTQTSLQSSVEKVRTIGDKLLKV